MRMTGMVHCRGLPILVIPGGEGAGKGIDPGARTQLALLAVQAAAIWIGAGRAEVCACLATTGVARAAHVFFQRFKGVFHPGLTDLLNAIVVAAHSIEVLGNDRVIVLGQCEPIDGLIAVVTRICSYVQTNLGRGTSRLLYVLDLANDDVRPRHKIRCIRAADSASQRRHDERFEFAVNQLVDLNWLHHRADGNRSGFRACIRWPAHCVGKLL